MTIAPAAENEPEVTSTIFADAGAVVFGDTCGSATAHTSCNFAVADENVPLTTTRHSGPLSWKYVDVPDAPVNALICLCIFTPL